MMLPSHLPHLSYVIAVSLTSALSFIYINLTRQFFLPAYLHSQLILYRTFRIRSRKPSAHRIPKHCRLGKLHLFPRIDTSNLSTNSSALPLLPTLPLHLRAPPHLHLPSKRKPKRALIIHFLQLITVRIRTPNLYVEMTILQTHHKRGVCDLPYCPGGKCLRS